MPEEQSPFCNLCGELVDDDPDEFMVEGRCLTCDRAFHAGRASCKPLMVELERDRDYLEHELKKVIDSAAHHAKCQEGAWARVWNARQQRGRKSKTREA